MRTSGSFRSKAHQASERSQRIASPLTLLCVNLVFASFLLVKEAAFGVALAMALINARSARAHPELSLVSLCGSMIGLAVLIGASMGNAAGNIVRDAFYIAIVPVFLISGLWLGRRGKNDSLVFCIEAWSVIQTVYMIYLSVRPEAQGLTRQEYRAYIGYAVPIAVLTVPLAIAQLRSGQRIWPILVLCFAVIAGIVTDSRTQQAMTVLAVLIAVARPPAWVSQSAIVLGAITSLSLAVPSYELFLGHAQADQLLEATPEAIAEWIPYQYRDEALVNSRWRAYEGYQAYLQWRGAGSFQQILGQGAGAQVDLGRSMKLGGEVYQAVPTLHNGWMYVLTKLGVVGVLYVLIVIFMYGVKPLSKLPRKSCEAHLLSTLLVGVIVSFPTTTGFFNSGFTGTPLVFLWGLTLGWGERIKLSASR